jgi:hypothetical protein
MSTEERQRKSMSDFMSLEEGTAHGFSARMAQSVKVKGPLTGQVIFCRRLFGYVYIFLAIIVAVLGRLFDPVSTRLSIQVPAPGDRVGRLKELGVSEPGGRIYPTVLLFVSLIMTAAWISYSLRAQITNKKREDKPLNRISYNMQEYHNPMLFFQAGVQGIVVALAVMPMAGIVNLYGLVFSVGVKAAVFSLYYMFDYANADTFKRRDIAASVDAMKNVVNNTSVFSGPLVTGLVLHLFYWGIVVIHLVETWDNSQTAFRTGVVLVLVVQLCVPIIKILHMYGVTGLRYYRAMCIAIDTVQLLTFIVGPSKLER